MELREAIKEIVREVIKEELSVWVGDDTQNLDFVAKRVELRLNNNTFSEDRD